ncbi:SDR family oxidoreductase [Albimonas sp. CAU 1670]|uniref:SDR family NAD(P)-dependent oxidoreductase n=1 Tax=Albimonas sp. CAU 1670 TaxID=3032599 RepID=UPI0023D9ED5E|nr:SDR family oxidoreductase [Albimonas sp. CAU 1670]MDF2234716.1 SDR family oxidoreductase [Albimonas sp. CAU 1670]
MFDIKGKVAIVTGSTKGIGLAIAWQFARSGAKVVISSRKADACQKVRDEIADAGFEAIAIPCHIGEREQLENLVAKTVEKWGRVDILVCNAASNPVYGPISELPEAAWDKVMDNNVKSPYILANNIVAPIMAKQGGGSIIMISSIAALRASETLSFYSISKASEAHLAKNLALHWGPKGIRVNAILPGLVKTDFAKALWEDPERLERIENKTPLRRIGQPDDIAGVAHFLAADASAYVTGQLIVADGGETIF